MTSAILREKPDVGNSHVRFDEGEVASAKPRRGTLLYKKPLATVLAAGILSVAGAMDYNYYWLYPDKKVSGCGQCAANDLCHPHLWGNLNPATYETLDPASGNFYLRFQHKEPLTASSDITMRSLYVAENAGSPFVGTFDLGKDRKVLVSRNVSIGYGGGYAELTVASGTFGVERTSTGLGNISLWLGEGDGNGRTSKIIVDGEDAVFQTAYSSSSYIGPAHPGVIHVKNGLFSGPFMLGSTGGSQGFLRDCGVLIDGPNARYRVEADCTRELYIGRTGGGNWMIVTNEADAVIAGTSSTVNMANAVDNVVPGPGNRLIVTDRSSFTTAGAIYVNSSSNNIIEVSGGSSMSVGGKLYLGQTKVGSSKPTNNVFRAIGAGTTVALNGEIRCGYADSVDQRIEITDRAIVDCNADFKIGRYSTHCVTKVTDGGILAFRSGKALYIGTEAAPCSQMVISNGGSVSNATVSTLYDGIIVGLNSSHNSSLLIDNGEFYAPKVRMKTGGSGTNTSVVVRNDAKLTCDDIFVGTASVGNSITVEHSTLKSGRLRFGDDGGTGGVFNLVGCDSRLSLGELTFCSKSQGVTWNFEISGDLPSAGTPLVSGYAFVCDAVSRLNVTLDETDFPIGKKGEFVLFHSTGVDISDATLANLTMNLPPRISIVRSADKRDLLVRVSSGLGMAILFQ